MVRSRKYQRGGKRIAGGAYGAVQNPALAAPWEDGENFTKENTVTKIMARKFAIKENLRSEAIARIDPLALGTIAKFVTIHDLKTEYKDEENETVAEDIAGRDYAALRMPALDIDVDDYYDNTRDADKVSPLVFLRELIRLLQIITKLARAGYMHGDIKRSNIMMNLYDGGFIYTLVDYGIAEKFADALKGDKHFALHYENYIYFQERFGVSEDRRYLLDTLLMTDLYSLFITKRSTNLFDITRKFYNNFEYAKMPELVDEIFDLRTELLYIFKKTTSVIHPEAVLRLQLNLYMRETGLPTELDVLTELQNTRREMIPHLMPSLNVELRKALRTQEAGDLYAPSILRDRYIAHLRTTHREQLAQTYIGSGGGAAAGGGASAAAGGGAAALPRSTPPRAMLQKTRFPPLVPRKTHRRRIDDDFPGFEGGGGGGSSSSSGNSVIGGRRRKKRRSRRVR